MYYVLTEAQAKEWNGKKRGVNVFFVRITTDGRNVTPVSTKADFPEAFTGEEPMEEIDGNDFPVDVLGQ